MKKYILILTLVFLCSCKKEKIILYPTGEIEKKYQVNNYNKIDGEFEQYYKDGKLMIKHIYNNGVLKDSSIYYKKNGEIGLIRYHIKKNLTYGKFYNDYKHKKIAQEGYFLNTNKTQKWKYYDKQGNLKKVFEYVNLCGEQYTNQGWIYNENKKIIENKSNYILLKTNKKKFKVNEVINLKFTYCPHFQGKKSIKFLCMSPKIDKNFCNITAEKLDTVFFDNNNFEIEVSFHKSAKQNLRGFISEFYYDKNIDKTGERKVYFEVPLLIEK